VQTIPIPPYPKGAGIGIEYAYDIDQIVFISVYDLTAEKLISTFEVCNEANLDPEAIENAHIQNRNTEVN